MAATLVAFRKAFAAFAMTSKTHLVVVAFYSPPFDDPLLNRVTAALDAPFCHVEMAFPQHRPPGADGLYETIMDAVTVMFDEKVEMVPKRFSRDMYQLMYLPVTATQWTAMRKKAGEIAGSNAEFSRYAMASTLFAFLPTSRSALDSDATCCSILTSQLLMHGGILPATTNPRRVTPSKLRRLILEQKHISAPCFGTAPVRLQQVRVQAGARRGNL